ncbi:hypothetical protein FOXB_08151 [Fusarium oxysporum f. sp. conglutinans Fo5176]|uniref:Uncharacterized protein n=2 Tax=Fusarium oxysporum f. sp. conglutinans TaxID=100902 RepID=F9FP21_FUSOF|nr:hypothetical protein FOXB_08151 [Fusarium oxysporum f. sp. conglutinans Fo5176]
MFSESVKRVYTTPLPTGYFDITGADAFLAVTGIPETAKTTQWRQERQDEDLPHIPARDLLEDHSGRALPSTDQGQCDTCKPAGHTLSLTDMYGIPDESRADLKGRIRGRKEALDAAAVNSMRAKLVALGVQEEMLRRILQKGEPLLNSNVAILQDLPGFRARGFGLTHNIQFASGNAEKPNTNSKVDPKPQLDTQAIHRDGLKDPPIEHPHHVMRVHITPSLE